MFKSTLIVILTLALALAAMLTRPSEQTASGFLASSPQPIAVAPTTFANAVKDAIEKSANGGPQALPAGYQFKDRVLWTEVVRDGQTLYTGVLSHWIKHDVATPAANEPASKTPKPAVAGLH